MQRQYYKIKGKFQQYAKVFRFDVSGCVIILSNKVCSDPN